MTHKIRKVRSLENMTHSVVFFDGVEKEYNMRILYFRNLKNWRTIKICFRGGSRYWRIWNILE